MTPVLVSNCFFFAIFSDAWNWLLRSDMKNDEASNWLKDKIKLFKTISKDPKGLNGQEFIKAMDFVRETFGYFLLETIQDKTKKELFLQKVTLAVANTTKRLQTDKIHL